MVLVFYGGGPTGQAAEAEGEALGKKEVTGGSHRSGEKAARKKIDDEKRKGRGRGGWRRRPQRATT
jgi:hypothetical protein